MKQKSNSFICSQESLFFLIELLNSLKVIELNESSIKDTKYWISLQTAIEFLASCWAVISRLRSYLIIFGVFSFFDNWLFSNLWVSFCFSFSSSLTYFFSSWELVPLIVKGSIYLRSLIVGTTFSLIVYRGVIRIKKEVRFVFGILIRR